MRRWLRDFWYDERGGGKGGGSAPASPTPSSQELEQIQAITDLYKTQGSYMEALLPWQQEAAQKQIQYNMPLIQPRAELQQAALTGQPLPGRYSALGSAYETSPQFESAMTGTAEWLQSRGLLKSGLMGELSSKRAADIAVQTEGQRRQELTQSMMMGAGGS